MKIFTMLVGSALFSSTLNAQCAGGLYATDVYPAAPTVVANIPYGSNLSNTGSTVNLALDVYKPTGSVATNRPLLIMAHGGSFVLGTRTSPDVVDIATRLAKKGFVVASITYRLGIAPIDSLNATKAVVRAVQDMKAAIRFFYKDVKIGTNAYGIDTNNIFIGGVSAGAIAALHVAYLDKECEMESHLPLAGAGNLNSLGGLEGTSGNAGFSTRVKGVVNLCGALAVYKWLETGNVPFVSVHGDADATVGYNRQRVAPFGINLIYLDGTRMLKERATALGVTNPTYTFKGADHVPFSTSVTYMDTTVNMIRDFLISTLGCTDPALQPPNALTGTAVLYSQYGCAAGAGINDNDASSFSIYPNPSQDKITIESTSVISNIAVTNLSGKVVMTATPNSNNFDLNKDNFGNGILFVTISTLEGTFTRKVMFN